MTSNTSEPKSEATEESGNNDGEEVEANNSCVNEEQDFCSDIIQEPHDVDSETHDVETLSETHEVAAADTTEKQSDQTELDEKAQGESDLNREAQVQVKNDDADRTLVDALKEKQEAAPDTCEKHFEKTESDTDGRQPAHDTATKVRYRRHRCIPFLVFISHQTHG